MDPAILLRVVHDLQARILHLENELAAAYAPREATADEDDAEVR